MIKKAFVLTAIFAFWFFLILSGPPATFATYGSFILPKLEVTEGLSSAFGSVARGYSLPGRGVALGPRVRVNLLTGEVAGVSVNREFSLRIIFIIGTALAVGVFTYIVLGRSKAGGKTSNNTRRLIVSLGLAIGLGAIALLLLASQDKSGQFKALFGGGKGESTTVDSSLKDLGIKESELKKENKDETIDWKTYESYDYGYKISFPKDWLVNNTHKNIDSDLFFEPNKKVILAVKGQNVEELKNAASRQQVLDQIIEQRKNDANNKNVQSKKSQIGSYEGVVINSDNLEEGVEVNRSEIVLVLPSGKLYQIVADIDKNASEELVKTAEKVANSFAIVSEANISPRLSTFSGTFVGADTCEVDLGAFGGASTKPLDDSSKCGFTYPVDSNTSLFDLESWYIKNFASSGWLPVSISTARLINQNGQNADFFIMVRCASQGDFDQEALIMLVDNQVSIESRGVKIGESPCQVSRQVKSVKEVTSEFIKSGFRQAFDLSEKSGFENLELGYIKGWKDRQFNKSDGEMFSWATGGASTSGTVVENKEKNEALAAFYVSDSQAATVFSLEVVTKSINQIPDVQNVSTGYGGLSDIRGVWFSYDLGDVHYYGTGSINGSQPIYMIVSTPKGDWENSRFVLLEMMRSIRAKE